MLALVVVISGCIASCRAVRQEMNPVEGGEQDASVDGPDDGDSDVCEPTGLLVHLAFDESSGSNAADSSGNGHDGTLIGLNDDDWVMGRIGNALDFDGNNDRVNSGSADALDDLEAMSMCAWIFPRSYPNEFPSIADKSEVSSRGGWNFYLEDNDTIGFLTNERKWATGGIVELNEWQHGCATWDGSNGIAGITLYLNGAVAAVTEGGSNGDVRDSDSQRDLIIGRVNNMTLEFDGLIDDYRLYNRVLSAGEIGSLFDCAGSAAP